LGIFIGMFSLYCLLASQAWIVADKIKVNHFHTASSGEIDSSIVDELSTETPPKKALASKVTPLK
ncbi:MAG: hypothetical protein O2981_10285, partial [Proteobacteria bacterium]|nr:hypothetical protein [Pseudomonadota bacterium]